MAPAALLGSYIPYSSFLTLACQQVQLLNEFPEFGPGLMTTEQDGSNDSSRISPEAVEPSVHPLAMAAYLQTYLEAIRNATSVMMPAMGYHQPLPVPVPKKRKRNTSRNSPVADAPSSPAALSNSAPGSPESSCATPRSKSFQCKVCKRAFGYKHVLQNHERTHTGEKPFECPECKKRFTRDHHLKTHRRLHTGEKPYRCDHCDRKFVQVANLRRHLRVHTGERPYACTECSSRFSDSNQLKAHTLIHKNMKPFHCNRCGNDFRRRHHLSHHKCSEAATTSSSASATSSPPTEIEEDAESWDVTAQSRVVRVSSTLTVPLESPQVVPVQTDPVDLSMSNKMGKVSNNNINNNNNNNTIHVESCSPRRRAVMAAGVYDMDSGDYVARRVRII